MKLHLISLGCDKNRVDSEKLLLGLLRKYPDAEITDDPAEADLALVNTCAFIGDAKQESINTIIELGEYKSTGKLKKIMVTGCLAERYREDILAELPEVDEVIGVSEYVDALSREIERLWHHESYTAYLKIAEGCDKYCSYCAIPSIRGHYRSVPMETLVSEAERLAALGARELILVAQETTLYGTDLYGKKSLPELLRRLSAVEDIVWIRLLYSYPEEIDDELIDAMATLPKVLHYLDIPVQHASDHILEAMHRKTREAELRERIAELRRRIPDIVLRTTLITGFPGETEEDFEILRRFVSDMRFDRLGVFPYSKEEGTAAAKLKPQITKKISLKRRNEIMALQKRIAYEKEKTHIGRELTVMVVGYDPENRIYVARSYMDSPEIDSVVYVNAGAYPNKLCGEMFRCRIIAADGYDLIGEMVL